mgnify:CR=1 FL=1
MSPPRSTATLHVVTDDPRPPPALPSAVLGMLVFILTEIMMFAGMVSAFMITKSSAVLGWPPPGQPRLPVDETLVNTAALLLSGGVLFWAGRVFERDRPAARGPLMTALALGTFFVIFQGVEWWGLLSQGLTMTSSQHGAFFYLIVGTHALHAIAAIGALGMVAGRHAGSRLQSSTFQSVRFFWYFVVLVWPVLYVLVYL